MSRILTIIIITGSIFYSESFFSQITEGRYRYRRSTVNFDVKVGVSAGIDRNWLKGDVYVLKPNTSGGIVSTFTKFKGQYAYHAGLYLDFQFTDRDFAQLDIKWVQKSWKQEGPYSFSAFSALWAPNSIMNKIEVVSSLTYIEIPIRYKYKISSEWYASMGPFIGINIVENHKQTDDFGFDLPITTATFVDYQQLNYGLNVGFFYQLESGLNFSAEYQHGFADINNYQNVSGSDLMKNHFVSANLSVGYTVKYGNRLTNHITRRKGLL